MAVPYEVTSHETFDHDSLDSLAYDWERVANPDIAPKRPLQIFLPQTTEEVAQIVSELASLGKSYRVRSKGHSSNDLVLDDRGTIICMQQLDRIMELDPAAGTLWVQSGAVLAKVDEYLDERGWGLPIIGDHNHITAGGFAAVGGISPASHRHGMFLDNVQELEYVTPAGEIRTCSPDQNEQEFYAVLGSTGQFGVITRMKLRVLPMRKRETILKNELTVVTKLDAFIDKSARFIRDPGDVVMERGLWVNFPIAGQELTIGQFSAYHEVKQGPVPNLVDKVSYNYLHGLGNVSGRLPSQIDQIVKYMGMAGVIFSPPYASIKNVEGFTDKVMDSTVGDPTRMFIVLGPMDRYETLFRQLYDLMLKYRKEHGCFTMISVYVKAIRSPYLAQGRPDQRFCELMFYVGTNPEAMTPQVLESLVSEFDDIVIDQGAFRYMHTKTVKDPERRKKIDPNAKYAEQARATLDRLSSAPPRVARDGRQTVRAS